MKSVGMKFDRGCEGCSHAAGCCSIYRRLGQTEGPPVGTKVLVAFGIPIIVFIIVLAVAGTWLGGITTRNTGATLLSLLIAVAATAAVVLGIWKVTQKPVHHNDTEKQDPLEVQR